MNPSSEYPRRLSPQQLSLWRSLSNDASGPYRVSAAVVIEGAIDRSRLTAAIESVIHRHEILQTPSIEASAEKTRPSDQIGVFKLEPVEAWAVDGTGKEAAIRRSLEEMNREPIDLDASPVLRGRLREFDGGPSFLLLSLPALYADADSMSGLFEEIAAAYEGSQISQALQYSDVASWLAELLEIEEARVGRQYWNELTLEGWTQTSLPFQSRVESDSTFEPQAVQVSIKEDWQRRFTPRRDFHATMSGLLLACWGALIARLTGERTLILGALISGRDHQELNGVIGPLDRRVPLRLSFRNDQTLSRLWADADEALAACVDWGNYFDPAAMTLSGQDGVCPIGFEFHRAPETRNVDGLKWRMADMVAVRDRCGVSLACVLGEDSASLRLQYDATLHHRADIERIAESLAVIVEQALDDPAHEALEGRWSELPILPERRRAEILELARGKEQPLKSWSFLGHFEAHADNASDAIAIRFEDQSISYAELNARANQYAHWLASAGIQAEDQVAILLNRSPEILAAILAIWKTGAAHVPLDPGDPRARLQAKLDAVGAKALITTQALSSLLAFDENARFLIDSGFSQRLEMSRRNLGRVIDPQNLAYTIFTSGSTGEPKQVGVSCGGLANLARSSKERVGGFMESVLQFASWGFDASVAETALALSNGGTLQMTGAAKPMPDDEMADLFERAQITQAILPPSALAALPKREYKALKTLIVVGEDCVEALADQWGSDRAFLNGYGPTETSVCATIAVCAPGGGKLRIGAPLPNVSTYVVDPFLELLPFGGAGELCIGGEGVARGYINSPSLTAECFPPDPFSEIPGRRMYRSGDRALMHPNGELEFLGRLDEQLKIRGFRVELGEIRAALCAHSSVHDAVVMDRARHDGATRLVAYVVCDDGTTEEDFMDYLAEVLPPYMIPAKILSLPFLPLNLHGKIDRDALPEPDLINGRTEDQSPPPRTPAEELIATVWRELLGLERIGVYDNFFSLGGHSIAAVQLVSRVQDLFQIKISIRQFFDAPTIEGLTHTIELERNAGLPLRTTITPTDRTGDLPLSFSQQEMWLTAQLDPKNPAYNLPLVMRLRGSVDVEAMRRSLNQLIERHEILRTSYHLSGGRPVQRVHPAAEFPLTVMDLRNAEAAESIVEAFVAREAQSGIDLANDPIMRGWLFQISDEDQVFFVLTHHIVFDAWSGRIFVRELRDSYEANRLQQPMQLSLLPIQYGDYAVWQRNWMRDETLQVHLDYWTRHLEGHSGFLNLPLDRPRSPEKKQESAAEQRGISAELSGELRSLALKERATLFMVSFAAFKLLLYRYTRDEDLVVGTPALNRDRIETEGMIGLVMNTLAIRTRLSGAMTFQELLAAVRESCLNAYVHQGLPFDLAAQTLRPNRKLATSPIFQALFSLQSIGIDQAPIEGLDFHLTMEMTGVAKYDLSFDLVELPDGLNAHLMYNKALFEPESIRRMIDRYIHLLREIIADPSRPLAQYNLLTAEERWRTLTEWNGARRPEGRELCVHQAFERQVALTPTRPAVVFGGRTLTYEELNGKANSLAEELRKRQVAEGVFVPVLMNNSFELLISYLAINKCGGAFTPLSPDWPAARLEAVLDEIDGRITLFNAETAPLANRICASGIMVCESQLRSSTPDLNLPANSSQPIYAIYTSGSTGKPKGAINLHRGVINRLLYMNERFDVEPEDVILHLSAHIFDASIWQLFWPLINGAKVVLPASNDRLDFNAVFNLIEAERVTFTDFVPSLLTIMLEVLERNPADRKKLSTLRCALIGGEALTAATAYRFKRLAPHLRILNTYGPTETSIGILMYDLPEEFTNPIPLGRPIDNTYVLILDEDLNLVLPGLSGELYIGGDCVGEGYLKNEEATKAAFIPNPFPEVVSSRLYRTGDCGRHLPSGEILFQGRRDNQIKLFGVRIELGEIEAALRDHPSVSDAAVLCSMEEGEAKELLAYVTPTEGSRCIPADLRDHLRAKLPAYMVPSTYISLAEFPLNSSGKLDRASLPKPEEFSYRGEGEIQARPHEELAPPEDPIEVQLLNLWEETLKTRPIGVNDRFFDVGGHSLAAVQLAAKVQSQFGVSISLTSLYHGGSVRDMALEIRSGRAPEPWRPIVAIQTMGDRPPLFFIHPIGGSVYGYLELARSLGPEQPFYALQAPRLDEIGETGDAFKSIEEMAAAYLREIRIIQPAGPYHLGGWSMGGTVAFEMAQQLSRAGETVALLAILDTAAPEPRSSDQTDDGSLLWALIRERAAATNRQTPVRFEELEAVDQQQQLSFLLEHLQKAQFVEAEMDVETLQRYVGGFRAREAMLDSYQPGLYPGRLILFRAATFDQELVKAGLFNPEGFTPTYGWERVCARPPVVRVVPGAHATIVKHPHVEVLAAELRAHMIPHTSQTADSD